MIILFALKSDLKSQMICCLLDELVFRSPSASITSPLENTRFARRPMFMVVYVRQWFCMHSFINIVCQVLKTSCNIRVLMKFPIKKVHGVHVPTYIDFGDSKSSKIVFHSRVIEIVVYFTTFLRPSFCSEMCVMLSQCTSKSSRAFSQANHGTFLRKG